MMRRPSAPHASEDPAPPDRSDMAGLFARYARTRDTATRDALVDHHLLLARHLARRYRSRGEQDDLDQVASLGLLKAIERFDPDRGISFSSFAVPTILGELKRYFRDLGWAVRVPRGVQELSMRLGPTTEALAGRLGRSPTSAELAAEVGVSVEEVLDALAAVSAHRPDSLDTPIGDNDGGGERIEYAGATEDPGYGHVENAVVIGPLLDRLPARDREILHLRFHEDLTQREIGERLGISQMHVSRLLRHAIKHLQRDARDAATGT